MAKFIQFALLACSGTSALSQTSVAEVEAQVARMMQGTIYTIPHRESADGVLRACGLEFSALNRDFSTRGGAPVKLVGSFYLRPLRTDGLAYTLKISVFDRVTDTKGIAPANAFVRAPNGNAPARARRTDSDTPGYALFVGALDEGVAAAFASIVDDSKLVVGFNRTPGQQDVATTIDLTVIDTQIKNGEVVRERSSQPVQEFTTCTSDLMKLIRPSK